MSSWTKSAWTFLFLAAFTCAAAAQQPSDPPADTGGGGAPSESRAPADQPGSQPAEGGQPAPSGQKAAAAPDSTGKLAETPEKGKDQTMSIGVSSNIMYMTIEDSFSRALNFQIKATSFTYEWLSISLALMALTDFDQMMTIDFMLSERLHFLRDLSFCPFIGIQLGLTTANMPEQVKTGEIMGVPIYETEYKLKAGTAVGFMLGFEYFLNDELSVSLEFNFKTSTTGFDDRINTSLILIGFNWYF